MKIAKKVDSSIDETSIDICAKSQDDLKEVMELLESLDDKITGVIDDQYIPINIKDVLYFESVDKKTFAYTLNKVYGVKKWLYQLEETLPKTFFRCSKSIIVNLSKIKSFSSSFNSKIIVNLVNGEKLFVSRKYVNLLKIKLKGVK